MDAPLILAPLLGMILLSTAALCQVPTKGGAPAGVAELKAETEKPGAGARDWVALGDALMQQVRDSAGHDFSEAGAAYSKALVMDAKSTDAMLGLAWVKNSEHLFEQGKGWAEKALAYNPRLVDAHSLLGDYALERGSYDEAYDHYQSALDLRQDLSTLSRAAMLLWQTGDPSQAQLLMKKAIDAGGPYPENEAWCRVELARMHFNAGAMLPAEMEAGKALGKAPENPRALAMMGQVLAAKGDFDAAIEMYERSVKITPNHQALRALVGIYGLREKPKKEDAFARVVALHRPDPARKAEMVATHGHFHDASQGSADFALFLAEHDKDLKAALEEAMRVYETYKNIKVEDSIAWCHYKLGDYGKARLMIERAMKWNTPDPGMLFHRGMIHYKLGDAKAASAYLNQAIGLNPAFDPVDSAVAKATLSELEGADAKGAK